MPRRRAPKPPPIGRTLSSIAVRPRLGGKAQARLFAGALSLPCVIGPGGFVHRKREGDGATPIGRFAVCGGFFRADREARPHLQWPLRACRRDDGWCDEPASARYNRPVRLPVTGSHERMWREDRLYDIGLVLDYNLSRTVKGRGSAIFLHMMAPARGPTAGCVALRPADLRRLLPRLARRCLVALG